jgi:hypothetical protein
MSLSTDNYAKVKAVMEKYGIPEWIWYPAMMVESGGDTNAHTVSGVDDSYGLFQINLKANKQYSGYNLNDPVVNATIAARDFLLPGYTTAKTLTSDTKKQAEISYSGLKDPENVNSRSYIAGGIKPAWTSSLKTSFDSFYKTIVEGGIEDASNQMIEYNSTVAETSTDRNILESILVAIIMVGLVVLILIFLSKMISSTQTRGVK